MPERMETCPNCNNELTNYDWDYFDTESESWYISVEKYSCECPHCKKVLWLTLPYILNEDDIEIEIEGD